MSSLKDDVDKTQLSYHDWPSIQSCRTQNKCDMSVTPPVSHVEMWPYVASAAARSSIQARTAVRILASLIMLLGVGAAEAVGAGDGAAFATFVEHRYDDWHILQWEVYNASP